MRRVLSNGSSAVVVDTMTVVRRRRRRRMKGEFFMMGVIVGFVAFCCVVCEGWGEGMCGFG